MNAVRDALVTLDEHRRTSEEVVFQFATWVEEQSGLAVEAVIDQTQRTGSVDSRMFQADILKTTGGNSLSGIAIHETAVENRRF